MPPTSSTSAINNATPRQMAHGIAGERNGDKESKRRERARERERQRDVCAMDKWIVATLGEWNTVLPAVQCAC